MSAAGFEDVFRVETCIESDELYPGADKYVNEFVKVLFEESFTDEDWKLGYLGCEVHASIGRAFEAYRMGEVPTTRRMRSGVEFLVNDVVGIRIQQSAGAIARNDGDDTRTRAHEIIVQTISTTPSRRRCGNARRVLAELHALASKHGMRLLCQAVSTDAMRELLDKHFGSTGCVF